MALGRDSARCDVCLLFITRFLLLSVPEVLLFTIFYAGLHRAAGRFDVQALYTHLSRHRRARGDRGLGVIRYDGVDSGFWLGFFGRAGREPMFCHWPSRLPSSCSRSSADVGVAQRVWLVLHWRHAGGVACFFAVRQRCGATLDVTSVGRSGVAGPRRVGGWDISLGTRVPLRWMRVRWPS